MKTEENSQLDNSSIRLLEYLKTFQRLHVLCACCGLLCLIVIIFAYRPLMIKSHNAKNRLHELETLLLNHRHSIAASEKLDLKGRLIMRKDIPLAIAELTRNGRELGLDFNSITPKELQDTDLADISKLPIDFTIETEYKNLGQFLTFIEKLPSIITEVESLSICRKDRKANTLSVKLILCLYVET